MRISDWSSDVCSSDLPLGIHSGEQRGWDQIVDRMGRVVDEIVEFIFRHGSDSSGIGPSGRPPVRPLGSGFGHGHAVVISGSASLAVSATRTSPWLAPSVRRPPNGLLHLTSSANTGPN